MPREQFNKYRRHQRSRSSVCSSSESSFIWPRVGLVLLPWMICLGTFKTADNISISHWSLLSIIVSQIFIPRPRSDHWLWPIQAGEASSCLVGRATAVEGKLVKLTCIPCTLLHLVTIYILLLPHSCIWRNILTDLLQQKRNSSHPKKCAAAILIFIFSSSCPVEKLKS